MKNYFKRLWKENTGEDLTNSWGNSTYYFETDEQLNVIRQLQIFENGKILKYQIDFTEDEHGILSDQPLDRDNFEDFAISKDEFKDAWNNLRKT